MVLFAHNLHVLSQSAFEKKMERNLNRGMAISKWLSRALYYDLSELTGTGLCVEEYVHLFQNGRDLDAIGMRVLGALGEAGEQIEFLLVVSWCGSSGCCGGFVLSPTLSFKRSVGYVESRCVCCFRRVFERVQRESRSVIIRYDDVLSVDGSDDLRLCK